MIFLRYGQNSQAVGHVNGTDDLDAMEFLEILLHASYVKVDFLAFHIGAIPNEIDQKINEIFFGLFLSLVLKVNKKPGVEV